MKRVVEHRQSTIRGFHDLFDPTATVRSDRRLRRRNMQYLGWGYFAARGPRPGYFAARGPRPGYFAARGPRPGYFAARFEELRLQLLCCVECVSPEVSSLQLEVDIHFTTVTDLKYPFTKWFDKERQPNFELE